MDAVKQILKICAWGSLKVAQYMALTMLVAGVLLFSDADTRMRIVRLVVVPTVVTASFWFLVMSSVFTIGYFWKQRRDRKG